MPCVFRDAGLVLIGHDPAFFLLLVVSCCNSKLRQLNKYSVYFNSCHLGLLLHCVSNFVLSCNRFKIPCKGLDCCVLFVWPRWGPWPSKNMVGNYTIEHMLLGCVCLLRDLCSIILSCWLLNLVSIFCLKIKKVKYEWI